MRKLVSIIAALSIIFSGAISPVLAAEVLTDEGLDSIVAGDLPVGATLENNTLDLKEQSQRFFKGLSNANTVDSANAVQSNVTMTGGGLAVSMNAADVDNLDGLNDDYYGREQNNDLKLKDDAQSGSSGYPPADVGQDFFAALSNLNTVDSANAIQSNITAGNDDKFSGNNADVLNDDGTTTCHVETNNLMILKDQAQNRLWALSNVNTVDSANAVQSNITVNTGVTGDNVADATSRNCAIVENADGTSVAEPLPETEPAKLVNNKLVIDNTAQAELMALSNLNTVDSANAVQSNISIHGADNNNQNQAEVLNEDGIAPTGQKILNNTLKIKDQAQHDLIALSNLNAVDSASAVQSNITYAHCKNINTNKADVENNDGGVGVGVVDSSGNPMDPVVDNNDALSLGTNVQGGLTALSNINSVDSANAVQSNITVNDSDYEGTAGPTKVLNINKNIAGVLNTDADPETDGGNNSILLGGLAQSGLMALSNINTIDSANTVQSNVTVNNTVGDVGEIHNISKNEAFASFDLYYHGGCCGGNGIDDGGCVDINCPPISCIGIISEPCTKNYAGDGNNILTLEGSAQIGLMALSNLTAVSSASVIQSNITANGIGKEDDGSGTMVGSANNVRNFSENIASVWNSSGTGDNTLELMDNAQQGLCALSNVNTVDSANVVQSNITVTADDVNLCAEVGWNVDFDRLVLGLCPQGDSLLAIQYPDLGEIGPDLLGALNNNMFTSATINGFAPDTESWIFFRSSLGNPSWVNCLKHMFKGKALLNYSMNAADVYDASGDSPEDSTTDLLTIEVSAQKNLSALSNLNTVGSANAVQSNITVNWVGGELNNGLVSINANLAKVQNAAGIGENKMKLAGSAQEELTALSNLNTVESANAVQSNVTLTRASGASETCFGCEGAAMACTFNLNSAEVRNYDKVRDVVQETPIDVPDRVNSLKLSGMAQQNLIALSNLNAVNSATAVQSNITVSSGIGMNVSVNTACVSNVGRSFAD
ncbi:MAG: hypothetical protein P9L93_05720 [Candidatus Gorgyraea atricola]|nr:hypothetical protein [Candidatus Gorgyraea atricola]